jgi:hypothetical protein
MSNVLARDRGLSGLSFYSNLIKTKEMIEKYLIENPDKFSDKEYFAHCVPIITTMTDALQSVIVANSIFPTNQHEVMIRRDYQNKAIGLIKFAVEELGALAVRHKLSVEPNSTIRRILKMLDNEEGYLKWWRKQNNALMRKFRELDSKESKIAPNPYGIEAALAQQGAEPIPFVYPNQQQPQPIQVYMYTVPPMMWYNGFCEVPTPTIDFGEPGRDRGNAIVPVYSLLDQPQFTFQQQFNQMPQPVPMVVYPLPQQQVAPPVEKKSEDDLIEQNQDTLNNLLTSTTNVKVNSTNENNNITVEEEKELYTPEDIMDIIQSNDKAGTPATKESSKKNPKKSNRGPRIKVDNFFDRL